jgi:uncharacterized protein (DUF1697 family)
MLRGVNVSGQRKVAMKELVELCQSLGFSNVASYLQSGNLKLNNNYFERTLKLRATTRNWNTTHKLYELART